MDFSVTEEQRQLVETARKFTRERIIPVAQKLDEHGTFPIDICKEGWELGLMNVEIPSEYGGGGLSRPDQTPLGLPGSEEQKRHYFGILTEDPVFAAYCCSEPDAGSDVAGMRTSVRKVG